MLKSKFSFLFVFILYFMGSLQAQDITGLWKGWLYNDSTGLTQKYEIAISEEKGKLFGYSHTWFILEDKQYYGVKKVSIRKSDGKILIVDDGLISNNYPVKPAKNVRQLNVLELDMSGRVMTMEGPFSTNRTKQYAPLTGFIHVERINNYWQTSLVPHLQELHRLDDLSFMEPEDILKNEMTINLPAENKKEPNENEQPQNDDGAKKSPHLTRKEISGTETSKTTVADKPISAKVEESKWAKKDTNKTTKDKNRTKDGLKKSESVVAGQEPVKPVYTLPKDTMAAAMLNERKTEIQQTVVFSTDSLELSLYDNGEVDGDTVTVLLNGEVILAKQGLSTRAVKKTIYIPSGTQEINLVMYAESLGSIPPNTGLLVVRDGKKMYEVRFSGDLQRNAGIIFTRKQP